MKILTALIFVAVAGISQAWADPIEVTDEDGKQIVLNRKGGVTAVVYSNRAVQNETRETAKFFDPFQGRKPFRGIVVVDLRKSMASWLKGVTMSMIRSDLDKEAKRVTPFYVVNGNPGNPRDDLGVVPDFDGKVCVPLGWPDELKEVEVIVYGPDGKEAGRWQKDKDVEKIRAVVKKLLDDLEKKPAAPSTAGHPVPAAK